MAFFGGGGSSVDLASPPAIGNTTPNTGAFTTLSFAPSNNTTGFSNTGNSLTGSNAQSLVSLAQTWNTTGNPTAFLLNVTATAAGSTSKLLDLQVGGSTIFYVPRTINEDQGVLVNNSLMIGAAYGNGWIKTTSAAAINIGGGANSANLFVNGGIRIGNGSVWGNSGTLFFLHEADNTLAIRNGVNGQTARLYNTFTSSTNFERLNFRWASNEFILDAEKGSAGGTLRGIKIGSATTSLLGFYGVTPVDQPATVTDPTGGGTQDAEARTAINAIIDRLQELGLIA
jgi:hypothetical protein